MKTYFAADFHLGLTINTNPREREQRVVSWLESIAQDAKEIYLLGDIFDFWWEYRNVVPKGFTRFLGTIAKITDRGIPIHYFVGNHDMWAKDYLSKECGVTIHYKPMITEIDGKRFYIAHGDGLGSKSLKFKFLLACFHSKPLCWLYSTLIHPVIGVGIGHVWTKNSRLSKGISVPYKGDNKEELFQYAKSVLKDNHIDYFIFGHRHVAITRTVNNSQMTILGDWIQYNNWATWDGKNIEQVIEPISE